MQSFEIGMKRFAGLLIFNLLACSNSTKLEQAPHIIIPVIQQPNTITLNCPADMVEVQGEYCPNAFQPCLKYKDPPGSIVRRCLKFGPSKCKSKKRQSMHFCIDTEEYSSTGIKPDVNMDWYQAKDVCEQQGKRLCSDEEWTFACEGEEMLPYPYGYERSSETCNIDQEYLKQCPRLGCKLIDQRAEQLLYPECLSPFGAHNMTGNVDEWVWRSGDRKPFRSGLKGGWWGPVRNRCRPMTTAHNEWHKQEQIGVRCCSGVKVF